MPSYTQYKRQVQDDDSDIKSWITVKGNHIPIKEGQSKEEAVKSFIEKKGGEKKDYTIAHKDKSGNATVIAEVSHHEIPEKKERKYPELKKRQVVLHRDIDDNYAVIDPDGAYTFYKNGVKGAQNRSLKRQEGAIQELGSIGYSAGKELNQEKKSDSGLVNAVAKALNKSEAEAESEIKGAAEYIRDLMKSNDLRSGDVEETLRGLGVEPDYAEEFMQWASASKRKAPKVKRVDKKAWNSPATDPWRSLYDSSDIKKKWSADWKK